MQVSNFIPLMSVVQFAGAGLLQQIVTRLELEIHPPELVSLALNFDRKFTEESVKTQSILSTYELEDLYFHAKNCTITTWNGKLLYDGKGKKTHTDLRRGVVVLHIKPNTLEVETSFKVNRLAFGDLTSLAIGNARTSYQGLKCEGVAALDFQPQLSIEWVQLFCDFEHAHIYTQVEIDGILRGKIVETFLDEDFGKALEEKLERDVATGLEDLVSTWLQSKLDATAASTSLTPVTSQAYQQASINEALEANEILDGILAFASALIKENYNDSISIPNIREGFEKNILHIVKVGAQFLATQGKAFGISTIERVGTARLHRNGSTVYFSSAFRFKELFLMYNKYRVEVIGIGPSGTISTSLAPVTAKVMVHVDFLGRKVYLDNLRISQLGKTRVRITGLGSLLNCIVSQIATWVVAAFKSQILNLVEDRVRRYTRETLRKSSLDDILSGKAFS